MADSPEGDVSQAQFTIAYDGPALRDGVMDVRDLAPALLAVGKLFDAANLTINGNAATVSVRVRATVPGSFEILIDLAQTITQHLTDLFVGDRATGVAKSDHHRNWRRRNWFRVVLSYQEAAQQEP